MSHNPEEFPQVSLEQWTRAASKFAPGGNLAALNWKTPEGLEVKPLYTAADVAALQRPELADTLPGFAPFMRGPQPTMYAGRPWTIRQYAGFSTAEDSNAFYRKSLDAGGQGVSVAFDLATHRGLVNEVKRAGTYDAAWNAAGFGSGVYFCKMQSGTFAETRKMLLMK